MSYSYDRRASDHDFDSLNNHHDKNKARHLIKDINGKLALNRLTKAEAEKLYTQAERLKRTLETNAKDGDDDLPQIMRNFTDLLSKLGPIARGERAIDPKAKAAYTKAWKNAQDLWTDRKFTAAADAYEVAADAAEEAGLDKAAEQCRVMAKQCLLSAKS